MTVVRGWTGRGAWRAAACVALAGSAALAADTTMDGRGGAGVDDPVLLPSGQAVTLLDVVTTEDGYEGLTYRFRFVAPWIAGVVEFGSVADDMVYLCEAYALPRVSNLGPQPSQIVVSLSERAVDFGATEPGVVQFFEAYRPEGETCVWELF